LYCAEKALPFHTTTTITFDVPERARVVVDVLGRRVWSGPAQVVEAGPRRTVRVAATGLASGVYLYRLVAHTTHRTWTATGRMTLVR